MNETAINNAIRELEEMTNLLRKIFRKENYPETGC